MLSGSNYLVSVIEVLLSEKKVKIERLAKIVLGIKGIIKLKEFFREFSDTVSKGHYDKEFVVDFPYENIEVIVNHHYCIQLGIIIIIV